jgi:hypothetical protein
MASASSDPPFKVKALYDYASGHDDDLNFSADEVITVTAIEDADWYYGEYKDKATGEQKEGIFPMNFVERIVVEVPARPVRSGGARKKSIAEPQREPEYHQPEPPTPAAEPENEDTQASLPSVRSPSPPPGPPVEPPEATQVPSTAAPKPTDVSPPQEAPQQSKPIITQSPVEQPRSTPASPPTASPTSKPTATSPGDKSKPPPPDKPSSSSFKDRLALFNKGNAVPITPFDPHKPRADFPKKKFVPPPPSKNSYVPPPISHASKPKRDEETPALAPPAEAPVKSSVELERDPEENKPKQSLKERIAMLQTQQLNAQAIAGEKPKRPPKPKRGPSERTVGDEGEVASPISPEDEQPRKSHDAARPQTPKGLDPHEQEIVPAKAKRSMEIRREEIHDDSSAGEGDVSSAASMEHREQLRVKHTVPAQQSDFGDDEGGNDTPDPPDSDDEEEEQEEIDPEVARKIALRDRMMKLSGGMGMHGVFGAPMGMPMGGPPPPPGKKKKAPVKSEQDQPRKSHDGHDEEPESRSPEIARPVQLPFALPKVTSQAAEEPGNLDENELPAAPGKISQDSSRRGSIDVDERQPIHVDKPHGPRDMPRVSESSAGKTKFTSS